MPRESSQKFIARNRAPRVQIEYDVELYGAEKKVQVPFVMGVLADLSGKADPPEEVPKEHKTARGSIEERKFLEIDVDNFDDRLKAMKPRAAFQVENTLTGEGKLNVDITFESMDDFSPAAVARKVDALNKLLQARTQLANLMTFMDGKADAEKLIADLIQDPEQLQALVSTPKSDVESAGSKEA
jgi:type VI secretion system protein ImpB